MAKATTSTVQTILKWRGRVEDDCALALRDSQVVLEKEEQSLKATEVEKENQLSSPQGDPSDSKLSLSQLQVSRAYISQLNGVINRQIKNVQRAMKKVDEKREILVEAAKEKKVVEKLQEHQIENHKLLLRRKEQIKDNEVALRISLAGNYGKDR